MSHQIFLFHKTTLGMIIINDVFALISRVHKIVNIVSLCFRMRIGVGCARPCCLITSYAVNHPRRRRRRRQRRLRRRLPAAPTLGASRCLKGRAELAAESGEKCARVVKCASKWSNGALSFCQGTVRQDTPHSMRVNPPSCASVSAIIGPPIS